MNTKKINRITVEKLASLANLTKRRIWQLVEDKHLPPLKEGRLPLPDAITRLFAFYQRDGDELRRERLILCAAQRRLKEQELSFEQGKFILKDEHNAILSGLGTLTWGTVCECVERSLLEKLEQQLAALDLPPETLAKILAKAREDHFAAVDQMQRNFAASVESKKEAS